MKSFQPWMFGANRFPTHEETSRGNNRKKNFSESAEALWGLSTSGICPQRLISIHIAALNYTSQVSCRVAPSERESSSRENGKSDFPRTIHNFLFFSVFIVGRGFHHDNALWIFFKAILIYAVRGFVIQTTLRCYLRMVVRGRKKENQWKIGGKRAGRAFRGVGDRCALLMKT